MSPCVDIARKTTDHEDDSLLMFMRCTSCLSRQACSGETSSGLLKGAKLGLALVNPWDSCRHVCTGPSSLRQVCRDEDDADDVHMQQQSGASELQNQNHSLLGAVNWAVRVLTCTSC